MRWKDDELKNVVTGGSGNVNEKTRKKSQQFLTQSAQKLQSFIVIDAYIYAEYIQWNWGKKTHHPQDVTSHDDWLAVVLQCTHTHTATTKC